MSTIATCSHFLLLCCAAVVLGTPLGAQTLQTMEEEQQRLFAKTAPAVVFIRAGDGFGSGFLIEPDGLIVTNAHVVGNKKKVDVVLHDGRRFVGKVAETAANDVDLALIRIDVAKAPVLELGSIKNVRIGSWVASVGHGMGGIWTYTQGMVSNIYPIEGERPVFQTQIPLNPGNSGGPVIDRMGRVVGVVTAGITESNSINFAIRADYITRSLNGLAYLCNCIAITAPKGTPVFFNGKNVGRGPRVVVDGKAGAHEAFVVYRGKMVRKKFRYPETTHVDLRKKTVKDKAKAKRRVIEVR